MTKINLTQLIKYAFLIFFLYQLLGMTLPYLFPPKTSPEFIQQLEDQRNQEKQKPQGIDRIGLVEDTSTAFNARYSLITNSTKTLDISCHVVHGGGSTDVLFGEIYNAAERGVQVRILLDGKMGAFSLQANKGLKALVAHPNISLKYYNPLNLLKPWESQILLHDKFIIVDETYLLLGGRNLGDRYYRPAGYTGNTADDRDVFLWNTAETTEYSVLSEVSAYMDYLWNTEYVKPVKEKEDAPLIAEMIQSIPDFQKKNPSFFQKDLEDFTAATVPTSRVYLIHNPVENGPTEPWVGYALYQMALEAEETVLVQTPYSTGNKKILNAFTEVAQEKDLILLTNSVGSTPNLPAFSNYYYNREKFLATGAQIYEYQSTDSIHGKSLVFDHQTSAVGSFNMDDRSLYLSTETMLIIESPEFAEILTGAIEDYMETSLQVGADNSYLPNPEVPETPVSTSKKISLWIVSIFSRLFQFLI